MRLIIVSNRAPVNIVKDQKGDYHFEESPGGLASGLRAYVERMKKSSKSKLEIVWIGWPGAAVENEEKVKKEISKKFGTHCVFLSVEVMEKFYEGFCNKTLWPLFHYFPVYAAYEKEYWDTYISVNRIFCDAVLQVAKPGDAIWIHDYHLMLLPAMVKEKMPGATVGFFLHIPFPSYEVFRLLPSEWRKEILKGLLGSDLIGFHTFDYTTYFLRSALRILGLPSKMGEVFYNGHLAKADTFPMGIDYEKYHSAALSKEVKAEKRKLQKSNPGIRLILSIDRQDYSKGILNRLKGYEYFLQSNPAWQQKVVMMMVIVPSRIGVESYQSIKSKIDELVGSINGKFGNMAWTPILYQYRSASFTELIALYNTSDVALVTPLRDGMNLIAKEYIASRTDGKGVLILSEMAGAVDELSEAIIINPNNVEEIGDSMRIALEMKEEEQQRRVSSMQQRLVNYDVFKWADDFINSLTAVKEKQERLRAITLDDFTRESIISQFMKSRSRILFLDYDGTLSPYKNHPADAYPSVELLALLQNLIAYKNTDVVIISGRDRQTLDKWFGHLHLRMVSEHGIYVRENNKKKWELLKPIRKSWMKKIFPILTHYTERLPGSFVEVKEYSLVFHYRSTEYSYAELRIKELVNHLTTYTSNMDVQLTNGTYILEVRNAGVDKGIAAMHWLPKNKKEQFVFAAGDDRTDEDLFRVMPPSAISVKVGIQPSYAKYNIAGTEEILSLLKAFIS